MPRSPFWAGDFYTYTGWAQLAQSEKEGERKINGCIFVFLLIYCIIYFFVLQNKFDLT